MIYISVLKSRFSKLTIPASKSVGKLVPFLLCLGAMILCHCSVVFNVYAGPSITSSSYKILRNEIDLSGNVTTSASNKVVSFAGSQTASLTTSSSYKAAPRLGNLIVHPNTITDLSAVENGAAQVTLTWSAPPVWDGYTSSTGAYIVRWSSQGSINSETGFETGNSFVQNWVPVAPGLQESGRVLTGLPTGVTVYLNVKALDYIGNRAYISIGTASVAGVFVSSQPAAPSNLVAIVVSTSAINWQWQNNAGNVTATNLMASTGGSVSGNLAANTTFYLQSNLVGPNTSFAVFVQASNQFWVSSTTVLSTFTLANIPSNLTAFAVSSNSITAQWNKNSNPDIITSYVLNVSTMNSYAPLSGSSSTLLSTATLLNLTPNTSYFYQAISLNANNFASSPTVTLTTVTYSAVPTLPAFNVHITSITISWNANNNSTDTLYTIEMSTESNYATPGISTINVLTGLTTDYIGLVPNTTYYFRGKSVNRAGIQTAYVDLGHNVTNVQPPTLLGFIVYTTSATFFLGSNGNPVGTTYQVSSGVFSVSDSTTGVSNSTGTLATTLSLINLSINTLYSWSAQTINFSGLASSTVSVSGSTSTLSLPPTNLVTTLVQSSQVTVAWSGNNNPLTPPTSYQLQISTDIGFSVFTDSVTFALSATTTSLLANTTYNFRVRSFSRMGQPSDFTSVLTTTTLTSQPVVLGFIMNTTSATVMLASGGNPVGTQVQFSSGVFGVAETTIGVIGSGTPAATLTLFNLSTNTVYSLSAQTVNSGGLPSAVVSVSGSTSTLSVPPTNLVTASVLASQITVAWSGNTNPLTPPTSYQVQISTDIGFSVFTESVKTLNPMSVEICTW